MNKVLVSGMLVVDIVCKQPQKIINGEKHEVSNIMIQGGAPAGNAASALAHSGISTKFLGYQNESTLSTISKKELEKFGVETDLLISKENFEPAIAIVQVDPINGDRTVFYSLHNYTPLNPKEINVKWFENTDLLFVDGYDVLGNLELLKIAKKLNIPTILDLETGDIQILKQMISLGSHVILPLEGAKHITNLESPIACLYKLRDYSSAELIITDGANGSWAIENNSIIHQRAYQANVVDTTGCGDSFHAAYAIALLDNKNLKERLQFSAAYASIVAQYFGGRTYFPTKEEVEKIIVKNIVI